MSEKEKCYLVWLSGLPSAVITLIAAAIAIMIFVAMYGMAKGWW
jgi:hypothetical protein